ncbi:MAG: hypothetical protein J6K14_06575, partial [Clostridia bacterium]|nr:hypothetical protein [Clostridia bacterium]
MAENKNALAGATANATDNVALTERLDNAAERVAEAEKVTAAVAEGQSLRRAEQEQSIEQLQKAEEERRAQAKEAAKSVADRRAAVLDYTENYRQNQKIEKAARATVSKAKLERLAAEAEAKARAEREAEEQLRREREELMARRQRSSALMKKMENESEAEAPEANAPVAAPAEEAMPTPAAAPKEAPKPEVEEPKADAPVAEEQTPEETPDFLHNEEDLASADDAASAEEEIEIDISSQASVAEGPMSEAERAVNLDLIGAKAEVQAQRMREAEAARAVDEDIVKLRVSQMMPSYMIPDSLRFDQTKHPRVAEAETALSDAARRLENAVAASDRSAEARIAAALARIENISRRSEGATADAGAATVAAA